MADRLERSEMLRRRAASDIAHDLATPATVLESQLQAMIDGVVPTDPAGLEAARSAAAALAGVVADIDDLARAEAAPLQSRPERVDLSVAIPERRARARRPAPGARRDDRGGRRTGARRVGRSRSPGPCAAQRRGQRARPQPRRQGSSRWPRSAPDRRSGSASATPARGSRRATSTHVFERFYRADVARATDPATGRPTGLGLGLTIARELLTANGGAHRGSSGRAGRHDVPDRGPGRGLRRVSPVTERRPRPSGQPSHRRRSSRPSRPRRSRSRRHLDLRVERRR